MPFTDKDLPCTRSSDYCSKCRRSFSDKEGFIQHLENNGKHAMIRDVPHNCGPCARSFSSKKALIQHLQNNRHHCSDLHAAACRGKYQVLGRLLLNENADRPGDSHLPTKTQTGYSPMHCAAFGGHFECLKLMLSWQDGDPNVVDPSDGRTPVHLAVWKGHARCLQLLLSNGGNFEVKDHSGDTPLTLVEDARCLSVILYFMYLREKEARINENLSYQEVKERVQQEYDRLTTSKSRSRLLNLLVGDTREFGGVSSQQHVIRTLQAHGIAPNHDEPASEPYEVLARGEEAVDIFNQALRDGKARISQMQLAVIGDVEAGKTSLVRTLSGQEFVQERVETHGIDTSMVETTELDKAWHVTDLDRSSHLDEILADIVCKGVRSSSGQSPPSAYSIEHLSGSTDRRGLQFPPMRLRSIECAPATHNVNTSGSGSDSAFAVDSSKAETTHRGPQTPQRDMPVDQIIRRLSAASLADKDAKLNAKIIIWDFAGHPLYHPMHHVFLNSRSFYLVVLNLERFCDPQRTEEEVKNVGFWLNSVRVHTPQTTPIFLVGTHRDRVKEDDIHQAEKRTRDEFAETFGQQLVQCKENCFLFTVENSLGSTDGGAVSLVEAIEREARQLMRNEEELPIKWLHFEEQILKCRKEPDCQACMSKLSLKEKMEEHCGKVDEREFDSMLHFYHDSGVIILPEAIIGPETQYPSVNDLVVINPQYLVDVMTCLHDIPNCVDVNRQFRANWNKLQDKGVADLGLLKHAWKTFKKPAEELVGILEATGVLCPVQPLPEVDGANSSNTNPSNGGEIEQGNKHFIVPFHLKEKCLNKRWEKLCRKTWTGICTADKVLMFDFHSFLPPALFSYFVVRTSAESSKSNGMQPIITKHMAIFSFADNFFLLVQLHQKYNQIGVCARNRNGKGLHELFYALKKIMAEICQQHFKFLKFVLGPACPNPQCLGSSTDGKALQMSSSSDESDCEDDGNDSLDRSRDDRRHHVICVDPALVSKPLWCNSRPVHDFDEIKQWLERPQASVSTTVDHSRSSMKVEQCCLALVGKAMANEWKWVGRHLGVADATINSIYIENMESQDEQSYQVLNKWLNANGSKATVHALMKAIEEVGNAEVLEKFDRHVTDCHLKD